jgi:hypothetical protein
MNPRLPQNSNLCIRPLQYRDLDAVESLVQHGVEAGKRDLSLATRALDLTRHIPSVRRWYGLLKLLSLFPNPFQHLLCVHVAQEEEHTRGAIQISPFNQTRSTWRVDRAIVEPGACIEDIDSQLLRHCLETIWEARMWLIEVGIDAKSELALYRHNGFQRLAQITYWEMNAALLETLAQREPDLPNLLPVSNADAQLLCQLDTASMPPLVRQVFDRHVKDFQTSLLRSAIEAVQQWIDRTEVVSAYVFEPQRKAAIGYFQLKLCRDGSRPHAAELTVHPAYTWLYPELLAQMARITRDFAPQSLHLTSADYQPEREEYLEQIGAARIEHTLLMSRSVWHKLRESKPAALDLQLSEVLQGFQPARKPIPSRIAWLPESQHGDRPNAQGDANPSIEELRQFSNNGDRFDKTREEDSGS